MNHPNQVSAGLEQSMPSAAQQRLIVLVAALGYFVDVYDLFLFAVLRVRSLQDLGLQGDAVLSSGVDLMNLQMAGMLIGGVLWGILADRRGRVTVLFGSILTYSLATFANAFVQDVTSYAVVRFIAGVGLAGELGVGITLVSEAMPAQKRGYGTTIVACVGILGSVAAGIAAEVLSWRGAYMLGGAMGLALLFLRATAYESGLFRALAKTHALRGRFFMLFRRPRRALRYAAVVVVGLPLWYTAGILVAFSPEIAEALGLEESPTVGWALIVFFVSTTVANFASGMLSQIFRTRKRVILGFLSLSALTIAAFFVLSPMSLTALYVGVALIGFSSGYWSVLLTTAAEQFGTNLRATATTTIPNFIRGGVIPMAFAFKALTPTFGVAQSAAIVGGLVVFVSLAALVFIEETYGRDLSFVEE